MVWTAAPPPHWTQPWHFSCVCRIPTCSSLLRRRTMRTLQRAAAALIYPAILCLGVACERTDSPTGARPMASLADPGRLLVDDDLIQCPTAQYSSIQDAVMAAQPGDHIDVCPGTYE